MTKTFDATTSFYSLRSISLPQFTLHILVRNKAFIQRWDHYHHFEDEKTEGQKKEAKSRLHNNLVLFSGSKPWNLVAEFSLTTYATSLCGIKHSAEVKTNKQKTNKKNYKSPNQI